MSIRNGKEAYKSPIETIWSDIEHECAEHFEQMVLTAVQNVGIRVNKEELVKALAYDRDQYRKGWEDRDSEIVRCKDCRYNYGNAEDREYNPNDIVCTYFETDGMDASDYCSYGERVSDDK